MGPARSQSVEQEEVERLSSEGAHPGEAPQQEASRPTEEPAASSEARLGAIPEHTTGYAVETEDSPVEPSLVEPPQEAQPGAPGSNSFVPLQLGDRTINVLAASQELRRPLYQLASDVEKDRAEGVWFEPPNGSWSGSWETPPEVVRQLLCSQGRLMKLDAAAFDVLLASVGKELNWSKMTEEERKSYQTAALEQWEKWVENCVLNRNLTRFERRSRREFAHPALCPDG